MIVHPDDAGSYPSDPHGLPPKQAAEEEDKYDFGFPYEILGEDQIVANDKAKKLSCDLFHAFSWRHTKEGMSFWNDVYLRIARIADHGE